MDGGNDGWFGHSTKTGAQLARAIAQISQDYTQGSAGNVLSYIQFDSWVITHWDADQ